MSVQTVRFVLYCYNVVMLCSAMFCVAMLHSAFCMLQCCNVYSFL